MDMMPVKPKRKAQLEAYARQHGQSAVDALDDLLAAQLEPQKETRLSSEEWVRELDAWGKRNAPKNLPVLSNEALRRESLYDELDVLTEGLPERSPIPDEALRRENLYSDHW